LCLSLFLIVFITNNVVCSSPQMLRFFVLSVLLSLVISITDSHAHHLKEGRTGHECIHDHLIHNRSDKVIRAPHHEGTYQNGGRLLQSTTWSPIRISPVYPVPLSTDSNMSPALQSYVMNTLIPNAISRLSSLLTVIPVQGNLYAHRSCNTYYTFSDPYPCASYDSLTACANIDNGVTINFPDSLLGSDPVTSSSGSTSYLPAGTGLPNADFGVFVTAIQTSLCGTSAGGTLAYAVTCQRDSYDRPTWGRINLCPLALSTTSQVIMDMSAYVTIHEITHALGFTADSWPLFRNNDTARTPRTPRNSHYPTDPSSSYDLVYTCPSDGNLYETFIASSSTVNYFSERGMSACSPSQLNNPGNCVAKMVTPASVQAARDFFNCPSVQGIELENQMTTPCSAVGSHLEQRVFANSLMVSYIDTVQTYTAIELAILEDSGWYKPIYANADPLIAGMYYGYKQGCSFALSKCLTNLVSTGTPPHFYATARSASSGNAVCSIDRKAISYTSYSTYTSALPVQYQYWTNTRYGGDLDVYDYCPAVQPYPNGYCQYSENAFSSARYYGMTYGSQSLCFESSLVWTSVTPNTGFTVGCYPTVCTSSSSLTITVGPPSSSSSGYTVITCTSSTVGNAMTVTGYNGYVTCPDPAIVCGPRLVYNPTAGGSVAAPSVSVSPSSTATPSATISRGASPSPTATISPSPTKPFPTATPGSINIVLALSTTVIIIIAVLATVGVIIAILVIYFCCRACNRTPNKNFNGVVMAPAAVPAAMYAPTQNGGRNSVVGVPQNGGRNSVVGVPFGVSDQGSYYPQQQYVPQQYAPQQYAPQQYPPQQQYSPFPMQGSRGQPTV
jgi:leishmanolysin-like peptidase